MTGGYRSSVFASGRVLYWWGVGEEGVQMQAWLGSSIGYPTEPDARNGGAAADPTQDPTQGSLVVIWVLPSPNR
jgi:hypothetical protein